MKSNEQSADSILSARKMTREANKKSDDDTRREEKRNTKGRDENSFLKALTKSCNNVKLHSSEE